MHIPVEVGNQYSFWNFFVFIYFAFSKNKKINPITMQIHHVQYKIQSLNDKNGKNGELHYTKPIYICPSFATTLYINK